MDFFNEDGSRNEFVQDLVESVKVRTVARFCTDPVITANTDLGEVFSAYALGRGSQRYVVESKGRFAGILKASVFDDIDRGDWSRTKTSQVMTPADEVLTVAPEAELKEAIDLMTQTQTHRAYVVQDDQLLGVIERDDIVEFVELQAAMRT